MSFPKVSFPKCFFEKRSWRYTAVAAGLLMAGTVARATLPPWLQHLVGASTGEQATYRLMHLPGADILYPRPPGEARKELGASIQAAPDQAELYALRAHADEAALDAGAAEADWKAYVTHSKDPVAAKLELAAFYQRRLETPQLVQTLEEVAAAPALPDDRFTNPTTQRSWRAYQQLFAVATDAGLPPAQTTAIYDAFLVRYPREAAVYARYFAYLLDQKDYAGAQDVIARYRKEFPAETAFPVRAQAVLISRQSTPEQALAVYDQAFRPDWSPDLIQSYFALLEQTHRQRAFVAAARAQVAAHPDGPMALNALARIFYYDQQAGRLTLAQQTLDQFRVSREARNGAWTPEDLATLAMLSLSIHTYAEAARYDFALASTPGNLPTGEPAAQAGLAGLVDILLTAPEQPLALGAGNLTLYRDIATLDQGPGYWNGILSLWMNGTSPAREYASETTKAQSYFHRAKAADLLQELDRRFPKAPERATLHDRLILAEAQYGEPATVVAAGRQFLADFGESDSSYEITNTLADAYAQQNDTRSEFALYDQALAHLAAKTQGHPLTAATTEKPDAPPSYEPVSRPAVHDPLDLAGLYTPARPTNVAADQYGKLLDRYLGRLVATQQLPAALALLRRELDRSPDDPLLYERLANFLQQNNLSAQQEAVFQQAIARFPGPNYYDKLARLYLREKKRDAFGKLTRQVVDIFSGTELDHYFALVTTDSAPTEPGPQLALQLNLYAAKRFPHDLTFTHNLLTAYQAKGTANPKAYESLLRQQWFAGDDLRDEFFAFLSRTGKLDAEMAQLQAATPGGDDVATVNAAALDELAGLDVWTSQDEQSAPLFTRLAALYPAQDDLDNRAISIFRSLSYLDPTSASLNRAVQTEKHLLEAYPDSPDALATLGDLYAEVTSEGGEDLLSASPYWKQIPTLHKGTPAGFLTAATIFWDYFQYDDALVEVQSARLKFNEPTLFGYETGAIQENRGNLPGAIAEYTAVVTRPPGKTVFAASVDAAVSALLKPPSDAADSNLQSTAQSLFNATEAQARLVQLAKRPASAAMVDQATAAAENVPAPTIESLILRDEVLTAQHHQAAIGPLLLAALTKAKTVEEAAAIGDLAHDSSASSNVEGQLREVDVSLNSNLQTQGVTRSFATPSAHPLVEVYEAALRRQAALTPDPVQAIQLQYTLAGSLEDRKQTAAAAQVIDAVYKANPRLLGVVRATTDFYARTKNQPRAIATLLDAAKVATPQLARDFTLEAATRANDSGNPTQARALGQQLLAQSADAYDPQILAVIAQSYARQNDNAGLKNFYLAELGKAKADPALTTDTRKQTVAALRRGLIPALTRLNDPAGAEDQYLALLSAFPEDAGTANEAALYALAHGRKQQLTDFLEGTVKASPRDSRFAVLLAQVDTTFEDFPGALAAYNQAITIRKDRADLYQSRAELEVRLAAGDAENLNRAAADYGRLYLLTYHDPQWEVRLAAVRARQGRAADAVKALQLAYPALGPNAAANTFTIADQLASWNLLEQARTFAEQGTHLAGANLLVSNLSGAKTYVRILTRLGRPADAFAFLASARRANLAAPLLKTAAPTADDASADDTADSADTTATPAATDAADLKRSALAQRATAINAAVNGAAQAIGTTAQTYFTPEQEVAFASSLDALHQTDAKLALTTATAAGLADREAAWRKTQMLTGPLPGTDLQLYIALQQHRLAFAELAQTLEQYAARLNPAARTSVRETAVQAWRDAGDSTNELRLTRTLALANDASLRDRFFNLLLARDPAALATLAGGKNQSLAEAAVTYTMTHGSLQQASSTIAAHGRALPAVWTKANTALAGLYFASGQASGGQASGGQASSASGAAFTAILRSDDTIAGHLAKPVDTAQALSGDPWFPFASRYGILLSLAPAPGDGPAAEDFLPALLETAPAWAGAYLDLARTYAEEKNVAAAQGEFAHVLELVPTGPEALLVHDEQGVLLFEAGRHDEAMAEWRAGLALINRLQERNNYPERFYTGFTSIEEHLARRHLSLTAETDMIVRGYLAKNGNYRSNELLKAAYEGAPNSTAGAQLLLSLAAAATDPGQIIAEVENAPWLDAAAHRMLLEGRLQFEKTNTQSGPTSGDYSTAGRVLSIQSKLVTLYLQSGDTARAQALLDTIPASESDANNTTIQSARLVLAARAGKLETLLASYKTDPEAAPPNAALLGAALQLDTALSSGVSTPDGDAQATSDVAIKQDPAAARLLLEFASESKQQAHTLVAADFALLAQSRLDTKDLPGAMQVLRRLALFAPVEAPTDVDAYASADSITSSVAPDPNVNLDMAAALLEASHHPAEALEFLQTLSSSAPWNAAYRLRLGKAQQGAGKAEASATLTAVAKDAAAPYSTRTDAARALSAAPNAGEGLGSAELNLLTHASIDAAAARQPRFVAARLAAASGSKDKPALLKEALAMMPYGLTADQARLDLLLALPAKDAAQPALVLLLQQSEPVTPSSVDTGSDADSDTTGADSASDEPAEDAGAGSASGYSSESARVATLPVIALTLDKPAKVKLVLLLADIAAAQDDLSGAVSYLRLAGTLDAAEASQLAPRLQAVEDRIELERRNAFRLPAIKPDLPDPTNVRPRLTALLETAAPDTSKEVQ